MISSQKTLCFGPPGACQRQRQAVLGRALAERVGVARAPGHWRVGFAGTVGGVGESGALCAA